jgi:hypothetical protein
MRVTKVCCGDPDGKRFDPCQGRVATARDPYLPSNRCPANRTDEKREEVEFGQGQKDKQNSHFVPAGLGGGSDF